MLSQYLTAVNCAGSTPPAEPGLTYNTWTGKFHLEMHWWHAAHFPLWGRGHLLERSLGWYHGALERAARQLLVRATAGRGGRSRPTPPRDESPSNIGVFLIWQQPHLIYLLELLRAEGRDDRFLRRALPARRGDGRLHGRLRRGARRNASCFPPPLIPAQESYLADRATTAEPDVRARVLVVGAATGERMAGAARDAAA